ncbi:MAG: cysteine desulfurase family protein [Bacteroidia bacterium]
MNYIIYLDNNSTTRTDDRVIDKMLPLMKEFYANPSSPHHFGKNVTQFIKDARTDVSNLISCDPDEIIFTAGATEAINLALKGLALSSNFSRKKIITICTEHKAVLDTCKSLEEQGFEIVYLPVNKDGSIDFNLYSSVLDTETLLVAAMYVNNETGLIHDIKKMSEAAQSKGALFFCDATQAFGKISIDINDLGVDLLCFSGHKFHAPKGVGGLYIKKNLKNKITPQQSGGGQEFGIRSGTLNSVGIVGLGEACKLAHVEMNDVEKRVGKLRDLLETELLKISGTFINGSKEKRIYNTTNICFPNNDASVIIGKLKNIALSNGSACTSLVVEPSHVLASMGVDEDLAFSAIRFSLGKYNTEEEMMETVREINNILVQKPVTV